MIGGGRRKTKTNSLLAAAMKFVRGTMIDDV
jgi:hypothetical protein